MAKTDSTYTIRAMKRSDIRSVLVLERAIFTDAWPSEAFEEHLDVSNAGTVVVVSNTRTICYACYQIEPGQLHLTNLAVAPEHRRKSVAKGVLDHILDMAREQACELIYLEVRLSNTAAKEFYRAAGFVEIDRVANYYEDPIEDAIVMLAHVAAEGLT